ncbi:DUF1534 domain-containing protein, partial [Pseudomonas savastanoi]
MPGSIWVTTTYSWAHPERQDCRPPSTFSGRALLHGALARSSGFSFHTLQRGSAVHDALRRQEDAERPETACDAECRTIVEVIVPHAPAWGECSSRRSASSRGRGA